MRDEYSADKAVYHTDRLRILADGGQPNPVHVLLVLSDLCSHDCAFCNFRSSGHTNNQLFSVIENGARNNNPNRMIPFDKVMEILDDCMDMGVKAIEFTGGGEPTVHPQFDEILQATLDRGFEVGLITHGARLSGTAINMLMSAKWVRVSVDAATAATYAAVRRVNENQFRRTMDNLLSLVENKRHTGAEITIGMSFVVTRTNFHEVFDAALIAESLGVDTFRLSAEFGPAGTNLFADIADRITDLCADAAFLTSERFRVINHWPLRMSDLAQGAPDYPNCWYQHLATFIGGDQNVYRCCNTAYNERGLIGSIKDRSFKSLWNSDEKRKKFADFDASGCSLCHVNDRNRAIDRSLKAPAHVNFV